VNTRPIYELMTPMEAARFLGLSADYVRELSDGGKLPALRTATGRRLFLRKDVLRFAAKRARASTRSPRNENEKWK
jgi:excisionase family DNA binding protein